MLSDVILTGNSSIYLAQLVFSPIQLRTDDGVYTCEATIDRELDEFVMNTWSYSNNISLHTTGSYMYNYMFLMDLQLIQIPHSKCT